MCLFPSSPENQLTPVMFASGRLGLATRPALTGSTPLVKRIEMVEVEALRDQCRVVAPDRHDDGDLAGNQSAASGRS